MGVCVQSDNPFPCAQDSPFVIPSCESGSIDVKLVPLEVLLLVHDRKYRGDTVSI